MRLPSLLATLVALSPACALELGEPCIQTSQVSFDDPTRFLAADPDVVRELQTHAPFAVAIKEQTVVETARGDVVILEVEPSEVSLLSELAHHATHRCGGFTAHADLDTAIERANAVPAGPLASATLTYQIDNQAAAAALIGATSEANILMTIESLSGFRNRHHASAEGAQASMWLRDYWQQLAGSRADVVVEQVGHNGTPQKSVMMTITGTELPNEIVILGGHLDSLAGGADAVAPGADDDASGIAVATDVARAIFASGFRPLRTIKFIAYAGEEVGLRGSAEIADQFAADQVDVAAVMQLDMTNYNGSATDISFIRDFTDDPLTNFVASLVDEYLPGVTRADGTCGYACSDHASWNARGYPAVYPFEADFQQSNPSVHTQGDTVSVSQSSAAHSLKFAKLGAAFVAEVAKGALDSSTEPGGDPRPPDPDNGPGDPDDAGGCR